MKKYFLLGLMIAIAPNICFGAGARYTQLVREKQRKMEELEKCMGATNGLKIAGLSTIGLTAVGVAGNVAQAKKLDEYESGIESKQKELEKVNKDIAEKEAEEEREAAKKTAISRPNDKENNNASQPEQPKSDQDNEIPPYIAAPQNTTQEQYQENCKNSDGVLTAWGSCQCKKYGYLADPTGTCRQNNTRPQQPEKKSVNGQNSDILATIAAPGTQNNSQNAQEKICKDSGGTYTAWGSCYCPYGFVSDATGKCVVNFDMNNNTKSTKATTVEPKTNNDGTSSTGNNGATPSNKSSTQNNSTNQKPLKKNAPKTMPDNQSSGTEKESGPKPIIKTNELAFVSKEPVTPVDKTYVAPKAVIDTEQPASSGSSSKTNHIDNDHCESLRASGKFKTVTTMSNGGCKVECPYGKYLDVVHKTCESMYDVPGNTQRDASGIIYPKQTSTATNSGNNNKPATTQSLIKETQTTTQPRKNEQIITEGVTKANKQADLSEGEEVCWKKLTSYDGVEKVMMMLNGDCQIQCKNGYNFNTLRKACESKLMTPIGSNTGYIK